MMNIYCDNIMKRVFNWAYRKFSTQKPMSIYKRELPIVYIRLNSPEGIYDLSQAKLSLKKL